MTDLQLAVLLDQIAGHLLATYHDAKNKFLEDPNTNPAQAMYWIYAFAEKLQDQAKALRGEH